MTSQHWYLYLLECCDRSLYLGMTQSVEARVLQHWNGRGGRHTRTRGVAAVVGVLEQGADRAAVGRRERQLKHLSAVDKRTAFSAREPLRRLNLPGWSYREIEGGDACWMPPRLQLGAARTSGNTSTLSSSHAVSALQLIDQELDETVAIGLLPTIAQWTSWQRLLRGIKQTLSDEP